MTPSAHLRAAALACLFALAAGCAPTREDAATLGPRTVTASLLAVDDAVVPGRPLELVWRFGISEGWHLYWHGLTDSGYPPHIDLALPAGWTAEPPHWPVPVRHLSPGGILDHVYTGELLLRQTVTPPADLPLGTTARFSAALDWLVCNAACVPGDTLLTLELPVRVASRPTAAAALAATAVLPTDAPAGLVRVRREGGALVLAVLGAAGLEFYPDAGCVGLVDPVSDAAATGDALRLRLRNGPGALSGLLKVRGDATVAGTYAVDLPAQEEEHSPGG